MLLSIQASEIRNDLKEKGLCFSSLTYLVKPCLEKYQGATLINL